MREAAFLLSVGQRAQFMSEGLYYIHSARNGRILSEQSMLRNAAWSSTLLIAVVTSLAVV